MTPDTITGIYVQVVDPYTDLFLAADYWTRADDQVYVYRDGEDDPVAEIADEHFVSAAQATEESLADIPTTTDDAEVPP